MASALTEPVVRIRCRSPEDAARCRRLLEEAGLAPEDSLTWLVVREAHPDAVNAVLVAGGAVSRTTIREDLGKLIGWLIDRQGALAGRERNVKSLVERTLSNAGLAERWRARPDAELLASAEALHRTLMAEGAPFLSWDRFLELFCVARGAPTV